MLRSPVLRRLLLPLLTVALSGCAAAQEASFPSLAKRAIEGRWDVPPAPPVIDPPGPLPADLAGRLARWESDAAAAAQAFAAERGSTEALVAAGSGAQIASENWVVAQQAISRLQSTRAPLTAALADIDRLYLEQSIAESFDGLPEIYALRGRLAAEVEAEDAVIAGLSARLPGE